MADYAARISTTTPQDYAYDVTVREHRFQTGRSTSAPGESSGPGPFEFLASALGTCTGINISSFAKREGLPLEGFDIDVRIHRTERDGAPHWTVATDIALRGPLDDEQKAALLHSAEGCAVRKFFLSTPEIEERLVDAPVALATA
jgi:putative redox protein